MPQTKTSIKKTGPSQRLTALLSRLWSWRYGKLTVFIVTFALIGVVALVVSQAATTPAGRIIGKKSGKCLHNNGNKQVQGNPVSILNCQANNLAQHWIMPDDLIVRSRSGYCLDTSYSRKTPGTKVVMNRCVASATQKWRAQANGTLKHLASGLCLEVKDAKTADFTPTQINTCNTRWSQLWSSPRPSSYVIPTPDPDPDPDPDPPTGGTFPTCSELGPTGSLAAHSGSWWSDQGSASGKAITGDLIMDSSAPNYTTSNFSVRGKVKNELSGASSLNVSDFLVRHPTYEGDWALGYHNVTARRFRLENHSDGIRVAGTGNALYEDFCITGIAQAGDHSDGVQFYGSTNANATVTLRRGIITMPSSNATAGVFAADGAKGTLTVDTVLFIGGPYGIRINSDGIGKIALKHVRFRRNSFGAAPFSIASNIQITEWTDVAYEDGQAISPPHAVQP